MDVEKLRVLENRLEERRRQENQRFSMQLDRPTGAVKVELSYEVWKTLVMSIAILISLVAFGLCQCLTKSK